VLQVEISQSSATQRAGRASRLGPGTCIRCWSQRNHSERPPVSPPELKTMDPIVAVLEAALWGDTHLNNNTLPLLDAPHKKRWQRAIQVSSPSLRALYELECLRRSTPRLAIDLHRMQIRRMEKRASPSLSMSLNVSSCLSTSHQTYRCLTRVL
jgi:HrpA-like RNA helicase